MDYNSIFSPLLHDSAARANPFSVYAALRTAPPVFHSEQGYYVATTYDACRTVLLSDRVSNAVPIYRWWGLASMPVTPTTGREPAPGSMHVRDGVDHKDSRRFFAPLFSMRSLSELEPKIREHATRLFAQIDGVYDFMDRIAFPLVGTAVATLMSIPENDVAELVTIARGKGPALEPLARLQIIQQADKSRWSLEEYFERAVASAWDQGSGFLDRLGGIPGQSGLTKSILVANAQLVFSAGLETTAFFAGNLAAALYSDQMILGKLAKDRLESAVEEFLRLDGSAQFTLRKTTAPVEVADVTIPAGELVVLLLGAANRDPAQFADPNSWRSDRSRSHHLTFASGPHRCIGAPLALLISRIILEQILNCPATVVEFIPNGRLANRGPEVLRLAPVEQ